MERTLVLGATSVIAAEVVKIHAARGDRLHLVGRNRAKLAQVVAHVASPEITFAVADFARLDENAHVIEDSIGRLGGIDRVLIAHGNVGDQLESERTFAEAQEILTTNFTSVVSLLIPLANHFELQRAGRIGVITSVAGDRGRPRNYTYGAAKGALNIFLQGVRSRLYLAGVKVTTLKLGPVDTPMTETHKKTVLFGKPDSVAKDIVHAMDRGVAEAYVPFFWGAIMPIVKNTPETLFQKLPFLSGR